MHNAFLSRFDSMPVLVAPDRLAWFSSCLEAVVKNERVQSIISERMDAGDDDDDYWPDPDDWCAKYKPYNVTDGVLVIPVQGVLINNCGWQFADWLTGYDYIQRAFDRGMSDMNVQGIVFYINSPGGEASGNFDLVDYLTAARGKKPTMSVASDAAYSAAYNIAATANTVIVTRTGGVGSVGVRTAHIDLSKANEKAGIVVTLIFAGAHKVDGNPYEPLPKDVKERMQAWIDKLYAIFVEQVAQNRGMTDEAVRNTEALIFNADDAVKSGLADAVQTYVAALSDFVSELPQGVTYMATEKPAIEPQKAETPVDTKAIEAAARIEGATAERARIKGILGCDEAKNRTELALHIATTTDLTLEQAQGIMAATPEKAIATTLEVPAASEKTPFAAAMEKTGNPEVGADGGKGEGTPTAVSTSSQILSAYQAAGGEVAKKNK